MPWLTQMIYFAVLFLGVALALCLSISVLLVLFGIGVLLVVWSHVKGFLLEKGILNPTPGVRAGGEQGMVPPVIEGDYKRVDSE